MHATPRSSRPAGSPSSIETMHEHRHFLAVARSENDSANAFGCHCFRLCSPNDWASVHARLPQRPTAAWLTYLSIVYGQRPSATEDMRRFNLRSLEVFYPYLLPAQPCARPQAAAPLRRCSPNQCSEWLLQRPHPPHAETGENRSFVTSTDGRAAKGMPEWVLSQVSVPSRAPRPDGGWIEVVRRRTDRSTDSKGRWLFPEGAAAYGCWFLVARGSGIFVDAGRTLAVRSTAEAIQRGLGHMEERHPVDLCFAKSARREGYHSVQVLAGNDQPYGVRLERRFGVPSVPSSELLVSGAPGCMSRPTPLHGGCVPLALRTGWLAQLPCSCIESRGADSFEVLNCAGATEVDGRVGGHRNSAGEHVSHPRTPLHSAPASASSSEALTNKAARLDEPRCSASDGRLRAALQQQATRRRPSPQHRHTLSPADGLRRSFEATFNLWRVVEEAVEGAARPVEATTLAAISAQSGMLVDEPTAHSLARLARGVEAALEAFETGVQVASFSPSAGRPCVILPGLGDQCVMRAAVRPRPFPCACAAHVPLRTPTLLASVYARLPAARRSSRVRQPGARGAKCDDPRHTH